MVDVGRIAEDLKRMRESRAMTFRALGKKIGVSHQTIQDIEKKKRGIWVEDLEKWLNEFDSSIAVYLNAQADSAELDSISANRELIRQLKIAIALPEKAAVLRSFVAVLLSEVIRNEKSRQ